MGKPPLFQSSLRRALADTRQAHQKPWFFWSIEVVTTASGGIVGNTLTPEGAGGFISVTYPIVGSVLGAIAGIICIFIINFVLAPYRQRNEARQQITNLETKREDKKKRAQIQQDIGVLIIEGTGVLQGFKSVHTFGDALPIEEFQAWRGKVTDMLQRHGLNTEYPLWFRDVGINISDSVLADYISACEAGLTRLESILNTLDN